MKTGRCSAGLLLLFMVAASLLVATQVHASTKRPTRRAVREHRFRIIEKRAPTSGPSSPQHPLDNFFDWQKPNNRSPPREFATVMTPSPSSSPTPPPTPPMRPGTPPSPWLIEFSETGDQKSRRPSPVRKGTSPPTRPPPPVPTTRRPSPGASSTRNGNGHGVRTAESGPLPMSSQQQKKKGVFTKLKNVLTGKSRPKLSKVFGKSKSKSRITRTGSGSVGTDSAPSRWSMPLERTSRP